jgi:hypothetical protein
LLSKFSNGDQILNIPNKNFLFHWYEKTDWTDSYFNEANPSKALAKVDSNMSIHDFSISEIDLRGSIFSNVGLKAFAAHSEKIQPLFSGAWHIEKINHKAINLTNSFPPDLHMIG